MYAKLRIPLAAALIFALNACDNTSKESTTTTAEVAKPKVMAPAINADSAYYFVEKQVAFGPRVPNTAAHKKAGDWIVSELKDSGLEVTEQNFQVKTYDGKPINGRNIIASYNPSASKRILMAAHWDSRPFADKDDEKQNQPIDGANDGASGVAVLLEMARTIAAAEQKPTVGIDYIFFDVEDGGTPEDYTGNGGGTTYGGYCLGSEYWSKNPHKPGYAAYYGILLDMVGAKNATFRQEGVSMQVAPSIVRNIWNTASQLGYSQYFIPEVTREITDDHVPVIANAHIPMVDIIDLKPTDNLFFEAHHTHDDNLSTIDKNTLKAVTQTMLQVLYQE